MDSTIFVTAELRVNSDVDLAVARKAIEQFCSDMESESGCQQATATFDVNDPRRVILWERYDDQSAIEAHFVMPHTQAFIALGMTELVSATNSHKAGEA
ncbi:putative quinol monooxygenase [Vibrio tubiashii]|uniref:Antibiotic biosynthesis monooxygenase n=1 Tax=Vibrio tubiashii ATCC 19109 TaxID=1051646 RepID=F9T0R1_9VIBR|nr:antibiotic biosynthesis monooxygenase [Vibrio tubiashii]AIW14413.1 antibiotic biosynthesis monooxygenase [Vibrio tubiashii ATCC 19109]EGU58618.1 hypothetical protein VITU9109_00887 [Vibrio tubiashii ATCC 19109]EIF03972.1 hypothetical protein VT1337_10972 [Vibrio tubiashii NCIMB 1337 = ATCC 19106]